jgi:hypothetical protein
MELPDRWYYYGDDEWRLRSGTITARINMHVPGNIGSPHFCILSRDGLSNAPILADCITYRVQLWTCGNVIETGEYDSLQKAMSGCEEQIREYLEHIREHWERGAAITEIDELRVDNDKPICSTLQIAELEAKIAELEAELANRPIVWAIERIENKKLVKRFGAATLFPTKEDVEEYIPTNFLYPFEWRAVVYKGEVRWIDNGIGL